MGYNNGTLEPGTNVTAYIVVIVHPGYSNLPISQPENSLHIFEVTSNSCSGQGKNQLTRCGNQTHAPFL